MELQKITHTLKNQRRGEKEKSILKKKKKERKIIKKWQGKKFEKKSKNFTEENKK